MVVQHNMQAMNSNRMLGITTGAQAKATEKLSSGYKINRAADDAAGLSISEKMRKQINGLDRASTNAEDGVSAVQTAEGALTEVHSMLQRMNELAVQAANGTNSEDDREAIQNEIDQLTTEIDRVAETTKFNETYLLKGAADGQTKENVIAAHDAGIKGSLVANGDGTSSFNVGELKVDDKITIAGREYTIVDSYDAKAYQDIYAYQASTATKSGDTITDAAGNTYTYYAKNDIDAKEQQVTTAGWYKDGDSNTAGNLADEKDIFVAGNKLNEKELIGAYEATTLVSDYTTPTSGDKITINGKTFTYRNQGDTFAGTGATGTAANAGWYLDDKATPTDGTEITDANGNKYVYKAEVQAQSGVAAVKAGWYLNGITVDNSSTAKTAPDKTVSAFTVNDLGDGAKLTTAAGVTTTLREAPVSYTAKDIADIQETIGNLESGDEVTIADADGNNAKTYKIAGVTNGVDEYTADDLKKLITADSLVAINEKAAAPANSFTVKGADQKSYFYALPAKSEKETEISKEDAYQMIADELTKASNIGTDKDKQATVKNNGDGTFEIKQGYASVAKDLSFTLHVGADADMTNKIGIDIQTMDSASLGIKGLNIKDDTGVAATYAIDAIADAVVKVSAQRSALGAVQNRLEHTIANLDNVVENTTSAESRIRDTDMAEEMVEYSKNNILAQAGQSMLAQANQSTQGVLSLLG